MTSSIPRLSSYVEAFCFETSAGGTGGMPYHDSINIYIPSMKLEIANDGRAYRSDEPSGTNKTFAVFMAYIEQCLQYDFKVDKNLLRELQNRATEESREKIRVPMELAQKIDSLVKEKGFDKKNQPIDSSIAKLSKELFKTATILK